MCPSRGWRALVLCYLALGPAAPVAAKVGARQRTVSLLRLLTCARRQARRGTRSDVPSAAELQALRCVPRRPTEE